MGDYGIWKTCERIGYILIGIGMIAFLVFLLLGWFWVAYLIHILFFIVGIFFWWVWRPPKEIRDYYKEENKIVAEKEIKRRAKD